MSAFAQKNWGIDDLPETKSHVWLKMEPNKNWKKQNSGL